MTTFLAAAVLWLGTWLADPRVWLGVAVWLGAVFFYWCLVAVVRNAEAGRGRG